MIVINFKNYKTSEDALYLAKKIEKYLPNAIVVVSAVDIGYLSYYTKLKVYAQHFDAVEGDRNTGFLTAKAIKSQDASGSLLNHSEHRISINEIKETLNIAKKYNLKIIVCAANLNEVKAIVKLKPYAIAFEDPKLVGSGKSITKYKSNDLVKFVELLKNTNIIPLCGAGISTSSDVEEAYNLGCKGVLISSAIANVNKPENLLKEISKIR